jgi:hypothetical protein
MTIATGILTQPATAGAARAGRIAGWDRVFFTGMAAVVAVTVFAGFAPTYYLKGYYGAPAIPSHVHAHGVLFTSWIVLLVVQTALVASRRTNIHRQLGRVGGVVAAAMVALGSYVAIDSARRGSGPPGIDPLAFLAIPLWGMVVFPALVGAALWYRRRPDVHKRLMLIATFELTTAAIARLPFEFIRTGGPLVYFGLTDLFLLACVAYDLAVLRKLHRATLLGGLLLVASQVLRVVIAFTPAWMAFARWATQ